MFTHPNVILDIDQSSECGYGPPEFWTTHLRELAAGHQEAITQQSKLRILDALLDRAERIDYRYTQRRCCIELADRLADDMTGWAKSYVARHARPSTVSSRVNTPSQRLVGDYGTTDPETR